MDNKKKDNIKIIDVSTKKNKIECFGIDDYTLNSEDFDNMKFDLGIVYGWQRLIPQKVLDKFNIGVFGFHASPLGLPACKGRSPLNWSIIEGRDKTFNHFFKYNEKVDDGHIYSITKFEINI